MTYQESIQLYLRKNGFGMLCPRAVLFDMDGVLFDSMPFHAKTWGIVSREYDLGLSPEEAYMHEGRTGEGTINLLMQRRKGRPATADEVRDIYARKCELFNACPEAPRMPGALSVLEQAKAAGLELYVVTGSGQLSLLDRLTTNYPGYFLRDHVISSKDVRHGKPHPEPYLMALKKAGLGPWEAIVVENAPLGVQSAVAARIFTIAVNTGPLPPEALWNEGANLVFSSMQAFNGAWKELWEAMVR